MVLMLSFGQAICFLTRSVVLIRGEPQCRVPSRPGTSPGQLPARHDPGPCRRSVGEGLGTSMPGPRRPRAQRVAVNYNPSFSLADSLAVAAACCSSLLRRIQLGGRDVSRAYHAKQRYSKTCELLCGEVCGM